MYLRNIDFRVNEKLASNSSPGHYTSDHLSCVIVLSCRSIVSWFLFILLTSSMYSSSFLGEGKTKKGHTRIGTFVIILACSRCIFCEYPNYLT